MGLFVLSPKHKTTETPKLLVSTTRPRHHSLRVTKTLKDGLAFQRSSARAHLPFPVDRLLLQVCHLRLQLDVVHHAGELRVLLLLLQGELPALGGHLKIVQYSFRSRERRSGRLKGDMWLLKGT